MCLPESGCSNLRCWGTARRGLNEKAAAADEDPASDEVMTSELSWVCGDGYKV